MPLVVRHGRPSPELREALKRQVDEAAEVARRRFGGDAGQARAYAVKAAEARAWLAGTAPPGPWLLAEVEATGRDLRSIAEAIIVRADAEATAELIIEARRRGAKAAIDAANSPAAMHAAAQVDWPEPQ